MITPEYLLAGSGRLGLICDRRPLGYIEAPVSFAVFPDFMGYYGSLQPGQRCAVREMMAQRLNDHRYTDLEHLLGQSVAYVALGWVTRRGPRSWWVNTEVGRKRLVTCWSRPKSPRCRQVWRCDDPAHRRDCQCVSAVKIYLAELRVVDLA